MRNGGRIDAQLLDFLNRVLVVVVVDRVVQEEFGDPLRRVDLGLEQASWSISLM